MVRWDSGAFVLRNFRLRNSPVRSFSVSFTFLRLRCLRSPLTRSPVLFRPIRRRADPDGFQSGRWRASPIITAAPFTGPLIASWRHPQGAVAGVSRGWNHLRIHYRARIPRGAALRIRLCFRGVTGGFIRCPWRGSNIRKRAKRPGFRRARQRRTTPPPSGEEFTGVPRSHSCRAVKRIEGAESVWVTCRRLRGSCR